MWAKVVLALLCILMLGGARYFVPVRQRSLLATRGTDGPHVRLMTWNIGYADLEADSRAHTQDLRAVAQTIMSSDADAVALQELTGADQLTMLLDYLHGRYRGAAAPLANTDRVTAVLIKDRDARFENIPAGEKYALGATFQPRPEAPAIVVVSAHADAFRSGQRRALIGDVVDWAHARPAGAVVFIAGDLNLEVDAREQSNFYTDNLKNDSEAYTYLLKYFRDLGRVAGDTAINDRRIDYVFGPPETVLLRRAEVLRTVAVGHMDHWPLIIEVAI